MATPGSAGIATLPTRVKGGASSVEGAEMGKGKGLDEMDRWAMDIMMKLQNMVRCE